MVLKLIISLLLISQALGKCDLNAIFQTPDNRNLDQFEILERSNFKDGDEEPVAPSSDASPKSYANAQVSLRFGGGALPELYNHKQRSAIDYQTQYVNPYFGHPQSYHHFNPHYQPYPYPPNYYYPPPTYGPYLPPPAKVVEELVTDETAADKEITHFENVKHPEILKTVVLSNEEVGANERIVDIANSNVKFLNLDVEDVTSEERKADIGKLLTKALVPVNCFKCDQKRKLLVSYPIVREDVKEEYAPSPIMVGDGDEEQVSDCGCGERHPELPIGKRFNVDMDDLTNINGVPIELPVNHLKPQYLPGPIPFRAPYPAPAPVTYPSASLTNFAPKYYQPSYLRPFVPPTKVVAPPCAGYPKQYYGSGYSYSSGANYYSDPRQAVYYQHPTVVSMYNSQTVPFKRFEAVPKYNVLPKYDILPKYDVVPLANEALINALRKVNEQEKRRHGSDCGCSSCAKYTGELTY